MSAPQSPHDREGALISLRRRRDLAAFGTAAAVILAIAQFSSYLVQSRLTLHDSYVVSSFLHLTYIRNTGGVFGMLQGDSMLFAVLSTLTIAGLCLYLLRSPGMKLYQYVCFGIVVGAAAANVCDRLVYGAVIDFIDVQGIPYWNYVFNTADVAIHVGVWPLAIGALLSPEAPEHDASSQTGAHAP